MPDGLTAFEADVVAVLDGLQPGDVVTYGEVAAEAGHPGAARAVGHLLARSGGAHPWWRVVTAGGRLCPGHEVEHARLLRAEGTAVDPATGRVPPSRLRPARRPAFFVDPASPGGARPTKKGGELRPARRSRGSR